MSTSALPLRITPESAFTDAATLCNPEAHEAVGATSKLATYAATGGAAYGFTMGLNHPGHPWLQAVTSAAKVPILFLLTLAICLPLLHFLGLLLGARFRVRHTLRVLMVGMAITCTLLAAFAPVSLFFLISGSTYEFLLLFHVGVFAFCGAAGLTVMHRGFMALPGRTTGEAPVRLFLAWMALYMFVGTQMAYNLSPFVDKQPSFNLFRKDEGNFYAKVFKVARNLFTGDAPLPRNSRGL